MTKGCRLGGEMEKPFLAYNLPSVMAEYTLDRTDFVLGINSTATMEAHRAH